MRNFTEKKEFIECPSCGKLIQKDMGECVFCGKKFDNYENKYWKENSSNDHNRKSSYTKNYDMVKFTLFPVIMIFIGCFTFILGLFMNSIFWIVFGGGLFCTGFFYWIFKGLQMLLKF